MTKNVIHHGVLFVQDEVGANVLAIDLGDILCVYKKGEQDNRDRWRKGCFIQFYDSAGDFYRDEDKPTEKGPDDKLYYKGSHAIVEVECPNLSINDVCRAMMDTAKPFGWSSYFTYNSKSVTKVSNGPSYR